MNINTCTLCGPSSGTFTVGNGNISEYTGSVILDGNSYFLPDSPLPELLKRFSVFARRPVHVTSGHRTQAHQDALRRRNPRATRSSPHTHNHAADIQILGLTKRQTANLAYKSGLFRRTNYYTDGGDVHVDLQANEPGRPYSSFFIDWVFKY